MVDLFTIHIKHHVLKEHAEPKLVYELTVDQNPFIRVFMEAMSEALNAK